MVCDSSKRFFLNANLISFIIILQNSDLDQDLDEADDNQAFSDDDLPGDFDQSDPFFMRDDDERKKKTVKGICNILSSCMIK